MRGVILGGLLLAAMGCATVGKVGVNTSGLVSLASDCGSRCDPRTLPRFRPRIRSQWGVELPD